MIIITTCTTKIPSIPHRVNTLVCHTAPSEVWTLQLHRVRLPAMKPVTLLTTTRTSLIIPNSVSNIARTRDGDIIDFSAFTSELIEALQRLLRTTAQRQVDEFSKGEMFIMNHLVDSGGTALPRELSIAMDASSARVAAAVNSLQRKGLVTRHVDSRDRRRTLVTITERGRLVVMNKRKQMHRNMEHVMRKLGERDAKEYLRILKRLIDIINEADQ